MEIISLPQLATYVSYLFVVVAYAVKVAKIARMPLHLRWELYPVMHEKGYRYGGSYFEEPEWWTRPRSKKSIQDVFYMLRNYLFLSEYYRRNRSYWLGLYPWHVGFYLIIGFQVLSFLGALVMARLGLPVTAESVNALGRILYYLTLMAAVGSFVTGTIGSIGLLVNRLGDKNLRAYASAMDYFNYVFFLILFLALFFLWYYDPTLSDYREFWMSLITFRHISIEPATYVFIMLFALHLIHLPFTRSTHYIMKFFAFFRVRWDDTPDLGKADIDRRIASALGRPVSWSAPHIQGGQTWGEVAARLPNDKQSV